MTRALRDPETCPHGHPRRASRVVDSRVQQPTEGHAGYRRRRHRCYVCEARWTSYQSLINPRKVRLAHKLLVPPAAPA